MFGYSVDCQWVVAYAGGSLDMAVLSLVSPPLRWVAVPGGQSPIDSHSD